MSTTHNDIDIKMSPPSAASTLTDLKQYAGDDETLDIKPTQLDRIKIEQQVQQRLDDTVQRIKDTSEQ